MEESFLRAVYTLRSPGLDLFFVWLTKLGSWEFLFAFAAANAALLYRLHGRRESLFGFGIAPAVGAFNKLLKHLIGRPRPELAPWLEDASGFGMPSGHAMGSAAIYAFLAFLWGEMYPGSRKLLYPAAVLLPVAVSLSRLHLGVHWPTDVLAGMALGFGLAWIFLRFYRRPGDQNHPSA